MEENNHKQYKYDAITSNISVFSSLPFHFMYTWITLIYMFLCYVTLSSVRSNDIKPKLRPENKAEKHKQQTIIMIANHTGTINSVARTDSHFSVPWWMNGRARSIFFGYEKGTKQIN